MSLLKQQLTELFSSSYIRGAPDDLKDRMKIIFVYFGFGDEKFATMDDLGKSHDMTKANVSLIKKRLDGKKKTELSGLHDLEKIIEDELDKNNGYILYSDLLPILVQSGLVDRLNPFGLGNFQTHFNFGARFIVYNTKMVAAGKKDYKKDLEFIIARQDLEEKLKPDIQTLFKMPGKGGEAGIVYLDAKVCREKKFIFKLDELKKILLANDVWSREDENKRFWFLAEDRGNPIITTMGKIKKVSGNLVFEKGLIVDAIELVLSRRGSKEEREAAFPPQKIIQRYLSVSKFVDSKTHQNKYILSDTLNSRNVRWTSIDQGIVDYFKTHDVGTLGDIVRHLKSSKINKDLGALPYHPLLVEISGGVGKERKFAFIARTDFKDFNLAAVVEDAALGGSEGERSLWENRRKLSREEYENAQKKFVSVGEKGESLVVNNYLTTLETIRKIEWTSQDYPFAPYDVKIFDQYDACTYIDVKSTESGFVNNIHISYSELLEMRKQRNYQIYRIYEMSDTQARLRISENLQDFAGKIIEVLGKLPDQIFSKGISLPPSLLKFGDEILIIANS